MSAGGGEAREERSGNLAATILAPAGLAACSSGGEGREASGGVEPPVSPQRERSDHHQIINNQTLKTIARDKKNNTTLFAYLLHYLTP
jgi:hypothetical protein